MINDSETIFVGIDVSKDTLEVACDDTRKTLTFGNDEAGIQALLAHIKAAPSTGGRVGAVALEATGGFERDAAMALCGAGLPVMVVNPRQARDFAKAMGYLAKTDAIDARVLRHFAQTLYASDRREKLLMRLPDAQQVQLQVLIVRRGQLIQMRVAEDNRRTLSHPTQRKSIDAVRNVLNAQIASIDQDIDAQLKDHFATPLALLDNFKGIGTGAKACLMAALPELGRLNHKEIAKLVGVAPLNCDSGKHKGKRFTWGGRADVRCALYMVALSAARYNPIIKVFYDRLLNKGKPKKWRWWPVCIKS